MQQTAEIQRDCMPVDSCLSAIRSRDSELNYITESELATQFENAAVKSVVIEETASGFELHVTLTWRKDGPLRLMKKRLSGPRVWASMDALIRKLREFPNLPPLILRLLSSEGSIDASALGTPPED